MAVLVSLKKSEALGLLAGSELMVVLILLPSCKGCPASPLFLEEHLGGEPPLLKTLIAAL